MLNGDRSC
ncbi:unnamed protein product [Timema podura]|uniref:Uncharacterized protein n=1 Tax=Timema podura TaxID=61482 RepID=A0ABN7P084_TIMPD|nr:unnamed protein product [Timema podura]